MKIVKIINNNTVCAVDEKGKEQIVSGKEIGFGKSVERLSIRHRFRKST